MNLQKTIALSKDLLQWYGNRDRTNATETCEVRMRFVISNSLLDPMAVIGSSTKKEIQKT